MFYMRDKPLEFWHTVPDPKEDECMQKCNKKVKDPFLESTLMRNTNSEFDFLLCQS
jgi:hypothetical protein